MIIKKSTVASSAAAAKRQQPRGKIVKAILAMIEADPNGAWTTADLAMQVYGVEFEGVTRSHRVAVIRAMNMVNDMRPELVIRDGGGPEGQKVLYDKTRLKSYGLAEIKTDTRVSYQCRRVWRGYDPEHPFFVKRNKERAANEPKIKNRLRRKEYSKRMEPGGYWYELCEMHRAKFNGDMDRYHELKSKREADSAAAFARLAALMGKPPEPTRDERLENITREFLQMDATDEELELVVRSVKHYRAESVASGDACAETQQNDMEAAQ